MKVEQIIIQKQSFSELISQPLIRQKILKVVIQTLYNLGYQQSAKQLQEQSSISYYGDTIITLRNYLKKNLYQQAWALIKNIQIKREERRQVQKALSQLECEYYIENGDVNRALSVLSERLINEQRANQLCEQLIFGNKETYQFCRSKLQETVIQKCLDNNIEPRSMQKIIMFYIKMQKSGLINTIDDSFSLLSIDKIQRQPPMKICNINKQKFNYEISFIKFNQQGNRFITLGQSNNKIQLSLWDTPSLNNKFNKIISIQKDWNLTVQHVCWNFSQQQFICICTHQIIYIFNNKLQQINKITGLKKAMCCEYNPISQLLYVGGCFNYIYITTDGGDQISKIQPTMKIRQISFNNQGTKLYAIGASKPKICLIDLYQQKQQCEFKTKSSIMSLKIQKSGKIVITTKQLIYLLSEKLVQLNSFLTPENPNNYLIQAHLFEPWVITLTDTFNSYHLSTGTIGEKQNHWPGAGTFAVSQEIMISAKNQLVLWRSGPAEEGIMINQNQSELQNQNEESDDESSVELEELDSDNIDLEQS